MRIIENPNPKSVERGTCEKCGCVFEWLPGEVETESWNNGILGPGFSGYSKRYVKCPNCGEILVIEHHNSEEAKQKEWEKEMSNSDFSVLPGFKAEELGPTIDEMIEVGLDDLEIYPHLKNDEDEE